MDKIIAADRLNAMKVNVGRSGVMIEPSDKSNSKNGCITLNSLNENFR